MSSMQGRLPDPVSHPCDASQRPTQLFGLVQNEAPGSSLLLRSSHFGYEGWKLRGLRLNAHDRLAAAGFPSPG